jgi:hypothetical protein
MPTCVVEHEGPQTIVSELPPEDDHLVVLKYGRLAPVRPRGLRKLFRQVHYSRRHTT